MDYEKTQAASASRYASDQPMMDRASMASVIERISQMRATADMLTAQATTIADRLYGERPPAPESTGRNELSGVPAGRVAEAHDALNSLERELTRLAQHIERLAPIA
jgi:hypothetical protein